MQPRVHPVQQILATRLLEAFLYKIAVVLQDTRVHHRLEYLVPVSMC